MSTIQEKVKTLVFTLAGETTLDEARKLEHLIVEAIKKGVVHVVLDMALTTHIAEGCFLLLIHRAKRLKQYGGILAIAGASEKVLALFKLHGCANEFRFFASVTMEGQLIRPLAQ